MQMSPIGLLVCAGILLAGYMLRGPLIVSLLGSFAFGATALMTINGSSPLIYMLFSALVVAMVAARPSIFRELGTVFGNIGPIWFLSVLMVYAVTGALLFPRLFAGQTSVFIVKDGGIVESTLAPVFGNVTQVGYFALGGLTAIALSVLLLRSDRLPEIRRAFLFWCCLHAAMGAIDLTGKLTGLGDLLAPVRTASYAMLTDVSLAGFIRIAGAYSEASAFGGVSLAAIAFCYTYWHKTGSRLAGFLAIAILILALLSTSSTAYAGLAILSIVLFLSICIALLANRLQVGQIGIIIAISLGLFAAMAVDLFDERSFEPVRELIDTTIVNKMSSDSGQERTYWNMKSLQSVVDTRGMGIGFGSSRASSWPIAVISQLGLLGALLMACLLFVIVRGLGRFRNEIDPESEAVVASVRAAALGSAVSGSLVSGTADPGLLFMVAFAVVATTRVRAQQLSRATRVESPRAGRDLIATMETRAAST